VFRSRIVVGFGVVGMMMDVVGKAVVGFDERETQLLAQPVRSPQACAVAASLVLALMEGHDEVAGGYLWEGDVGVGGCEAEAEVVDFDVTRRHGGGDHHYTDWARARLESSDAQTR